LDISLLVSGVSNSEPPSPKRVGMLRRAHDWLLGQPPELRHIHPLALGYRHVLKILRERAARASNILVVSGPYVLAESAIVAAGKQFTRLGWDECTTVSLRSGRSRSFDLVYCETELQQVTGLERFFANARSIVAKGGRIVVHITNQNGGTVADNDWKFIQSAFGAIGPVHAHYVNGQLPAFVFRRYLRGLKRINASKPWTLVGFAGTMLYCMPLAALVNGKDASPIPSRDWVSVTVDAWSP
jgi:hypothetical protein